MRRAAMFLIVAAAAGAFGFWLRGRMAPPAIGTTPVEPALDLPAAGARITVVQRHDAQVPGSAGRLRVHLGDITRGQVELTLAHRDGRLLVPATSVRANDRVSFALGGRRYRVTVVALENELIGDDTATLEFAEMREWSEPDRIEFLLQAVADSGLTFVRNGSEHDGPGAAAHLRSKLGAAGTDRITTARQFIDHIATGSSLTGTPYEVRHADGRVQPLAIWLTEQLARADARDHP